MIRWKEALRAPEVAKGQQKYRVDWDATDGRNGGAQCTVWEILLEMERFRYRVGGEDLEAVALVLDLAKALRADQSPCGVGLGDALQLAKEDTAGAVRVLRASEAGAVRRMRGGAAKDHHGSLARVKMELHASTCCAAGRVK